VVGRTGELLVAKRDPQLAVEQRLRLENEGVTLQEDRVDMNAHRIDPFTLED
jgi:alkylated DNA nucleotide flippase Atl1